MDSDRWLATASADATAHLADAKYSVAESLYANGREFRAYRREQDDFDVLFGAYVEAAFAYRLGHRASVGIFGRYDLVEELEGSLGPNEFRFDPSGWSAGAFFGFDF